VSDTTARDALERSIRSRLGPLSHDELRVMDKVLEGLEAGVEPYGRLDLSSDRRDLRNERAQETRDWITYTMMIEVAADARRRDRIARFKSAVLGLNKTGADCTDCAAPVDELHADGCQWVEVVR
jgi:hypothetical protein